MPAKFFADFSKLEKTLSFLALRKVFARFQNGNKFAALVFFIPGDLAVSVLGKNIQRDSEQLTNGALDETYWNMSAYRLGEHAIRFSVAPAHEILSPSAKVAAKPDNDFLYQEMKSRLRDQMISFKLRVQFQNDPDRTLIEDPTIIWDEKLSPLVEIATIEIEQGAINDDKDPGRLKIEMEHKAFNPWHSIVEHRPLGGINRLRKAVYHASAIAHRRGTSQSSEVGAVLL